MTLAAIEKRTFGDAVAGSVVDPKLSKLRELYSITSGARKSLCKSARCSQISISVNFGKTRARAAGLKIG